MNPYLEQDDAWHNFHEQFPMAVVEMLVPQVRPNYFVRVDEHVYLHEMPEDRIGLSYVEIRDRRSRRLVTVIELLSPSNKDPGPDRQQYEQKRSTILQSPTHLIEIDLLRGGPRMPLVEEMVCDYCVLISGASLRPAAQIRRIGLGEPLPTIPVPLLDGDRDVQLDLQAILHRLYDAGRYEDFIYPSEPHPVGLEWARPTFDEQEFLAEVREIESRGKWRWRTSSLKSRKEQRASEHLPLRARTLSRAALVPSAATLAGFEQDARGELRKDPARFLEQGPCRVLGCFGERCYVKGE